MLHACHESRAVWLRRYHRLPRYVDLEMKDGAVREPYHRIRFAVPFVSYERDVFAWLTHERPGPAPRGGQYQFHPFMGLDCSRIRHAGLRAQCQWPWFLSALWHTLNGRLLPSLQSLAMISLGPCPDEGRQLPRWQQMPLSALQRPFQFQLQPIKPLWTTRHPFWRDKGSWLGQPLGNNPILLKILVWHIVQRNLGDDENHVLRLLTALTTKYFGKESHPCWLAVEGCARGGAQHSLKDVVYGVLPCQLRFGLLCEKRWMAELEEVGMFDDEMVKSRNFSAFHMLRNMSLPKAEGGYWRPRLAPEDD